jgi:hypothetical protein
MGRATAGLRTIEAETFIGSVHYRKQRTNNYGLNDTYAVIIPEDKSLSWFSLPTPRFVNPGALRRALELNRD